MARRPSDNGLKMTEIFFKNLAGFYRCENDLSNVTAAMCEASEGFRRAWLRFFFADIRLEEVAAIVRERPDGKDGGSRVDFFVEMADGRPYLIEVKIWDGNHHFGQYEAAYDVPAERLGYIVNYELEMPGYEVKTWREFYDYLSEVEAASEEERALIDGYLAYLQNVCNLQIIKTPMRLNNLTSLYALYVTLGQLLRRETASFRLSPYQSGRVKTSADCSMQYVEFLINGEIYCDFVVCLSESPTEIWINLQNVDFLGNKALFKKLREEGKILGAGQTFDKAVYDGADYFSAAYWFRLSPEKMQALERSESVEEQTDILRSFIDEVAEFLLLKSRG